MSLRELEHGGSPRNSSILSDPPSNFSIEAVLSESLSKLSHDDRLEIEEEIHGVACRAANETPELIQLSLAVFDDQVNLKKENNPSITVLRNVVRIWQLNGSSRSSCYLNDPAIRLRFLRCDRFDVTKAVQRLVDFLELMSDLFGDFVAERSVELNDFNHSEQELLRQSRNQYLPFRDSNGRRVLTGIGNCNFHMEVKLRYKVMMYLHWTASEDVETQIKGIVILCWPFDEAKDKTWEHDIRPGFQNLIPKYHRRHIDGLPVRVTSWQHYYEDTPYFRFLSSVYIFYIVKHSPYRSVYKVHYGSQTELLYKVAGYGVPVELVPMSNTFKVKFDNHRDWLNVIRTKASLNGTHQKDIVDCPRCNDVVFRKGPASRKYNRGNAYYRELIEDLSLEHFTGDTDVKFNLTILVMEKIENRGGRFLKWKNMWVVDENAEQVRKKIASAFKQINRNRKNGDSQQLVQAIKHATVINKPEETETSNPKSKRDDGEVEEIPISSIENEHNEFLFVQARKRLKYTENDIGNSCFGTCFHPIELTQK